MPVARSSHTATVVDGKIYVVGGDIYDDEGGVVATVMATDRVDVYDPAVDSWQQMAAAPTAKSMHAAAIVDGKIYVTGGLPALCYTSDALEAYDPVTDTWTTLASLSKARANHASMAFKGKLYVFGGSSSRGRMDLVEVYSPASNSWASMTDLPLEIDEVVAVAL